MKYLDSCIYRFCHCDKSRKIKIIEDIENSAFLAIANTLQQNTIKTLFTVAIDFSSSVDL